MSYWSADVCTYDLENELAECRGAGVLEVNDGLLGAGCRLHRELDQIFTRLCQGNNGDIVGYAVFVYQLAEEIEVGLRCRRKTDFDFFKAGFNQLLKEGKLPLDDHGFTQVLFAVARGSTTLNVRRGNWF